MQSLAPYLELFQAGALLKRLVCPVLVWNNPVDSAAVESTSSFTKEMETAGQPRLARSVAVFELASATAGGAALTLGRSSACAIHLNEESVSRAHAEVALTHHGWTAVDLGSKNGTWVGQAQIPARTPARLADGDRLQLGNVELFFMLPESFQRYLDQIANRTPRLPQPTPG
jgi:pSer/pThr/pTyr-binding forkhead associated (FHA) protein